MLAMHTVAVGNSVVFGGGSLAVIAGPCVIESPELCLEVARHAQSVCQKLGVGYIFKASFDKANRTSIDSYRGPGLQEGLKILAEVKKELDVPVLTDIHETSQVEACAEVIDILQIPAFLCRQTDLLVAAARTGRVVNVKKGQFLAPWDMKNVVKKLEDSEASGVLLTERGSSFGYNTLISDMTSIPIMREFGWPVIYDATHSVQRPGGAGTASGGNRQFIPVLTCCSLAAGADALFLETHPNPLKALSDAASQLPLGEFEGLLSGALKVFQSVR